MEYYTYAYLREDGTPYYIGRGRGARYRHANHRCKVPPEDRIMFFRTNLTDEEAGIHEIYLIALFGRKDIGTGVLRNLTDGGEGISGYKHTEKTKDKMRESHRGSMGYKHTPETISFFTERTSSTNKGRHWYNNGKINRFTYTCPDGFVGGKVYKPRKRRQRD